MRNYEDFAVGYERMCQHWEMTATGASVESGYEGAKNKLGEPRRGTKKTSTDSELLGMIVAFLHLNGVDV